MIRSTSWEVGISAIVRRGPLDRIEHWIEARERHYVCVCAVHIVMESQRDPALRAMVNQASLAVPGEMPLVWVARLTGLDQTRRVYGPDLVLSFCERAAGRGYQVERDSEHHRRRHVWIPGAY